MNIEIAKRTIYESEAIIKSNESLVGMGVWNIGNELKTIRDSENYREKGYKSFEEYFTNELSYGKTHIYRFIGIAENYEVPSMERVSHLGITKLLSLTELSKEERENFIEENPVEDMTTRELKQAIREKKELEKKIQDLENKEPIVIEKEVEKVVQVVPDDYGSLKGFQQLHAEKCYEISKLEGEVQRLKRNLTDSSFELNQLKSQQELLEKKAKLNDDEAKKYKQLKDQIENLSKQKDDLGRQIKARTELSGLVIRIEHILKTELAPIKYSRAIDEASTDEIVVNNLRDIVGRVQDWCNEIYKYIPKKNYSDVIEMEVIEYEQ